MKKRTMVSMLGLLAAASIFFAGCGVVKVVKTGEEAKYTGKTEFNAGEDVAAIWESMALPELNENAVDLSEFLTQSKGDLTALAGEHGKYSMGDSGELSYVVKGKCTVETVNTESQAGKMEVKLEGYSGDEAIAIQIGPVYKGSSVRDSLSFIKFGDYKNQEEWAAVSQSINKIIAEEIVNPADPASLEGKTVSFVGAFTVSAGSMDILITPVALQAE